MTGEVVEVAAVVGETAPAMTPAKIIVPDELKGEFEAHANRAAEAAARKTETRLKAEFVEQQRLASLSESDRVKAETDALKAKVALLEGAQNFRAMESRVRKAADSLGFVIPEVLNAVLQEAVEGGEVDEDVVARLAFERSAGYLGAAGKPKPNTLQASARTGTPVSVADPANYSTMTEEQIVAHANSLGGLKGMKYLADSQAFLTRGGRFSGS